ncbi:MAG: hypothetical protein J7M34_00465 [Anaerolineae bacterium]|nr:hypothetical protein [Anaerolineae bacterium]
MIAIEILQLVDQLEAVLNRGWRVPFTSSLLVDEEECLRLIDQMRMSVPDEIRQAQRILQQRDYILIQAEEQARQIVSNARREEVDVDVAPGQDVIVAAQQRAASIIAEARARSEEMQREADEYALHVLSELSRQLEAALAQVRNGIQALAEQSASSASAEATEDDEEMADDEL